MCADQTSPAFEEFLELMGTKVDIETFDKPKAYKAGLNKGTHKPPLALPPPSHTAYLPSHHRTRVSR
jgi:hypothetical protein